MRYLAVLLTIVTVGCDSTVTEVEPEVVRSLANIGGEYSTEVWEIYFPTDTTRYHYELRLTEDAGRFTAQVDQVMLPEKLNDFEPLKLVGEYREVLDRIVFWDPTRSTDVEPSSCSIPLYVWKDSGVVMWDCKGWVYSTSLDFKRVED